MSYDLFSSMLKLVLNKAGLDISQYSGHSFRRGGGASHGLSVGLPSEVIKAQGDWKSLSYLDYLDQPDRRQRASWVNKMYAPLGV